MRWTKEMKRFSVDVSENWSELFRPSKYNWIEFHMAKLYVEFDKHIGTAEIEAFILGFGVRFYWTYSKKRLAQYLKLMAKRMKKEDWWKKA